VSSKINDSGATITARFTAGRRRRLPTREVALMASPVGWAETILGGSGLEGSALNLSTMELQFARLGRRMEGKGRAGLRSFRP